MKYYLVIKMNTFKSVLMRRMNLEPIIQSELSQKEKDKYRISTHIWTLERWYWRSYMQGSKGDTEVINHILSTTLLSLNSSLPWDIKNCGARALQNPSEMTPIGFSQGHGLLKFFQGGFAVGIKHLWIRTGNSKFKWTLLSNHAKSIWV